MLWELAQWSNLLYAKIYIWGHCHTPGVVVRKHSEDIILEISCNSAISLNYLYDNLLPVCVEFYLILDWKKLSVFEMLHTFVNKYTKYTWIVTLIKHYLHDKTPFHVHYILLPLFVHVVYVIGLCWSCNIILMLLQDYNCTWAILYAMYAGCGGWRWRWSRGSSLHSKVTHCEFLSLLFRKKWKYKENVQKKNEVNLQILFGAFSWAWLGDLEYLEDLWLQWWLTSLQLLDYMYKRKSAKL